MSIWPRRPQPPQPTQPQPKPTVYACRLSVRANGELTTACAATLRLDQFPGSVFTSLVAPEAPRLLFNLPPETIPQNGGDLSLTGADGFKDVSCRAMTGPDMRVEIDGVIEQELVLVAVSKDFDPSTVSLDDLARIRGGMWTKMPFELAVDGQPRARDIAATDFLWNYPEEKRLTMVTHLVDVCKYTHCEVGPVVDSDGYHGTWTPNNWLQRWDEWMDMHQYLWNHGLAPVSFIAPDGWSLERCKREITPFLLTERAQKLIRIAVIAWEPGGDYSWSSFTWAGFAQWLRETLPNALILMHNAAKADGSAPDGPVGGDAAGTDENNDPQHNGASNVGIGWQRVAPHIHGWLIQTGEYSGPLTDAYKNGVKLNPEEWGAMFRSDNVGAHYHSINWHLVHGISAWPTRSAWADGRPVMLYDGEGRAYRRFWHGASQADSNSFGDYAVQCGAKGAFDGISPSTPLGGPVPWQRS